MTQTETNKKFSFGQLIGKGRGAKAKLVVILVLLVLFLLGAIPSYLGESWQKLPPVDNLGQIRQIREEGIPIPEWETADQVVGRIGGHQWSIQNLTHPDQRPALLFLLPQNGPKTQPYVEWVDIDGFFKWNIDTRETLEFTVETQDQTAPVQARYFLARDPENPVFARRQTVVVVQWYAWDTGGHHSSLQWFIRDQKAQLRDERVPWVAVCLRIPIDPSSTLEEAKPLATELAKFVQTSLMKNVFTASESS
ncbi:cyanoexosortase B system-associated protein [Spirulina sp. CS-785/01]|uniref:cyanoexosortase B system-associated protein n=1 Tax=Spirulina sp. CS-785/01 TaxID=3021716 RepID=UPI00232DCEB5|nr:cyanoexosortase B system-associated protein [Spirulina sp. CS-785/01]MDB9313060.1 cyanoexosortase B system-associated protein [Spirulina sp. CS-785/01]